MFVLNDIPQLQKLTIFSISSDLNIPLIHPSPPPKNPIALIFYLNIPYPENSYPVIGSHFILTPFLLRGMGILIYQKLKIVMPSDWEAGDVKF